MENKKNYRCRIQFEHTMYDDNVTNLDHLLVIIKERFPVIQGKCFEISYKDGDFNKQLMNAKDFNDALKQADNLILVFQCKICEAGPYSIPLDV